MVARRRFDRLLMILKGLGLIVDRGDWLEPGRVIGCAYPRRRGGLAALARQGVAVLVNLHPRAHNPSHLARYGLAEVHLPVADFRAPTPEQLERGVEVIARAVAARKKVAVHCGGGLGRTGTLLACYLVQGGLSPTQAIARVRAVRPGSIETAAQVDAVEAYGRR
jgi:atypical dual specificity phosphatase